MKEKIIKILLLFLIFLISVLVVHNYKKPIECKVLSVVEADEFYLDINNNGL